MRNRAQIVDLSLNEYRALLRQDFSIFSQRCFRQLDPQTNFLNNWHIEVLAAKLEACRQGRIRRLIINIPPRHLKSHCASIAFPAWCLGHNPTAQILCVSYAQDLSDKLARDCRSVMTSKWFQALFSTRPLSRTQALQEFRTTAHGSRLATSVGGVLTGRGADIIIIDDPLKPEEAMSESQRRAVNQWYDNTLFSRLNDKHWGCIILIMQRLHEDDLVGHVLGQDDWEILSFPAIAEQDEEHLIETPLGTQRFTRRVGDVLHPQRESRETLAHIRQTLGEYNFAGQYQQAPAPLGGGLIKTDWFRTYQSGDLPARFDQIVQSWDTANKVSQLSDYSVCTTGGSSTGAFICSRCCAGGWNIRNLNAPYSNRRMVLTKNRPEFAVTCGIRTRRRRFLTDFYEYSEGRYSRYALSNRKLEVLVASLAIWVVAARTLRSPTPDIGTELLARREKIEMTPSSASFERSPVPMARAHRPYTRAVCALPRRMPQT